MSTSTLATEPAQSVFVPHQMAQTGLPHRDPGNVPSWSRSNGGTYLILQPVTMRNPDTGGYDQIAGYPYGVIPRLLSLQIATQAVQTRADELVLGRSASDLVVRIGYNGDDTRTRDRVLDQLMRLAHIKITYMLHGEDRYRLEHITMIRALEITRGPDGRTGSISLELDAEYAAFLREYPIPADAAVIHHLLTSGNHSALPLDIYLWLQHRTYQRTGRSFITWALLQEQFGADYSQSRHFRAAFRVALELVSSTAPQFRATATDDGVWLFPRRSPATVGSTAPAPVLELPTPAPEPAPAPVVEQGVDGWTVTRISA